MLAWDQGASEPQANPSSDSAPTQNLATSTPSRSPTPGDHKIKTVRDANTQRATSADTGCLTREKLSDFSARIILYTKIKKQYVTPVLPIQHPYTRRANFCHSEQESSQPTPGEGKRAHGYSPPSHLAVGQPRPAHQPWEQ